MGQPEDRIAELWAEWSQEANNHLTDIYHSTGGGVLYLCNAGLHINTYARAELGDRKRLGLTLTAVL